MPDPTSLDLRLLAASMDRHDSATRFDLSWPRPRDVRIGWTDGASCPGYKELSEAMSVVVTRRFDEIRAEAEADLARDVAERRKAVLGTDP